CTLIQISAQCRRYRTLVTESRALYPPLVPQSSGRETSAGEATTPRPQNRRFPSSASLSGLHQAHDVRQQAAVLLGGTGGGLAVGLGKDQQVGEVDLHVAVGVAFGVGHAGLAVMLGEDQQVAE